MTDDEKELIRLLTEAAEKINEDSKRGPANWMVVSPQVAESIGEIEEESKKREKRNKKINKILKNNKAK